MTPPVSQVSPSIGRLVNHSASPVETHGTPPKHLPSQSELARPTRPTHTLVPVIERLATGTPQHLTPQAEAARFVAELPHLKQNCHRIEKIYGNTRINARHLAIDLLSNETVAFSRRAGTIESRMDSFKYHAVPLAEQVVKPALAGIALESIGLIVFVTSTGFVAPGVDAELIERLGLRRNIARVTVNFMGCAAAMNGLRVACDHVKAYPHQKALLICLELSSINATFNDDINDVIIHSIFGDGCAAAVIGCQETEVAHASGQILIRDHLSYLVEDTQDGIRLGIRDNGITCRLSRSLPDYIEAGVGRVIENYLAAHQLNKADIDLWAVHPGGTRIIQKAQSSLGLTNEQVDYSWGVLQEYGNMLSVSILFVLQRMLQQRHLKSSDQPATGLAFSFSPGVGIEGALFEMA
ncbi:MAG: type III polyketide synthase [Thainema sp.]